MNYNRIVMSSVIDFNVTNEDAKYLCDFMGIDVVRHSDTSYSWSDGINYSTHEDDYYKCMSNVWRYVGEIKVKDWNWLMTVVEKIESIDNSSYYVNITGTYCSIGEIGTNGKGLSDLLFIEIDGDNKKGVVYNCCISFVKWYNANVK